MILRAILLCIILTAFTVTIFGQHPHTDPGLASDDVEGNIVKIEITNHTFSAPEEIPAGWTTLSLTNISDEHHLMMAHKLPKGVSPADANAALENWKKNRVPAEWWFAGGARFGGQGLLAPGKTGHVTIFLEPGAYALVCGFTSEDGTLHFEKGTPSYLRVTENSNGAPEPTFSYEIHANNKRITTDKPVKAGRHTFKELLDGWHDVQLAKLNEHTDVEILKEWLPKWQSPTPVPFIGGLEPVGSGHTAYFTLDISPGRYAWICSKHPKDQHIHSFTVD